jgi:glycerophosphoryl diester phosphodiesterase
VISHAACAGHAAENTLAGIRAALDLGVDGIEIDVQATSDGVPVLMHDLTVDRTTNGYGRVAELSLDDIRRLDAGGEPPPTLADALSLTRGRVLLVMEIKQPGIETVVADTLRELNALADVMAWSFFPKALQALRSIEPRIPAALLIGPQSMPGWQSLRELAIQLGLQGVSVYCESIDEQVRRDTRRCGLALYAWTADAPEEIARLVALDVDGICSNYPERVATKASQGRERR